MILGARTGIQSQGDDDAMWKELFRKFVSDTFSPGDEVHIPSEQCTFGTFRTKGLAGCHLYFDDIVNTDVHPNVHHNLGLYQNTSATLTLPNAEGNLGNQVFNTVSGYNGRVDIYLLKITGFANSPYILYTGCSDTHLHFNLACNRLYELASNPNLNPSQFSKFTLHGTDGYLTWDGTKWVITSE